MALTPTATKHTSNASYQMGILVDYKNCNTSHVNSTVSVTPLLRRIGSNYTRSQHHWYVYYAKDTKLQEAHNFYGLLPNDTTQAGVNSAGHLDMQADVWYQWGPTRTYTVPNDGQTHNFGVRLECVGTVPRWCPEQNGAQYLYTSKTFPRYTDTPDPPKGVKADFNSDTRLLTYSWDAADCEWVQLKRHWIDANENVIKSGWFIGPSGTEKLYNKDVTAGALTETIPTNVVKVTYEVVNYSKTKDASKSVSGEVPTASRQYVWIKVGDSWQKAIPWVKVNGVWKKATKAYVKVDNVWTPTT